MVHFATTLIASALLAGVARAAPTDSKGSSGYNGGYDNNNGGYNSGSYNGGSYNNDGSYNNGGSYNNNGGSYDNKGGSYSSVSSYDNSYNGGSYNGGSYNNGGYNKGNSYTSTKDYNNNNGYSSTYESGGYSSAYNGGYNNNGYSSTYESGGYSSAYNGGYNNGGYNSYTSTEDSTSTQAYESTSTSSAYNSYNTMSYGSGSSNWNSGGYDSCVQQCMASYGSPMATYTPDNSGSYGSGGSSGTGATWTVIVAPTQGVLRYVPFAVNASVGDTVKFVWNANVHTVTKSSQLELCNKTSDAPFASGSQNKSFVFTQVVNSTDPTFFYCGTPNHCQKGMFGIINPPSALSASTSVANMMPSMVANNSDIAAMNAYTNMQTLGNNAATTWGNSMDMSGMPDWAMPMMATNIMYSRTFLAANPEVLSDDGKVDLSAASSLMVPQDITAALAAAPASSSSTPAAAAAGTPSSSATPAANAGAKASGARGLAASGASAAVVAIAAAFFAL